jgi:hypothetical protein
MKIQLALFALSFSLCVEAQPPGVRLPQPVIYYGTHVDPRIFFSHDDTNKEISKKHTFQVWMKDSTSLTVEGKIEVDSASYYLSWTDRSVKKKDSGRIKKIYPGQTRCIAIVDENGSTRLLGPATEDSWLFPVIEGRLTVYAPFAENNLPDVFFLFIRDGEGPLTEMTMDNLANLMQGNAKAFGFLKKGKMRKAIEQFNE